MSSRGASSPQDSFFAIIFSGFRLYYVQESPESGSVASSLRLSLLVYGMSDHKKEEKRRNQSSLGGL